MERSSSMEPLESRLLMSAVRPDAAFNLTDFGRGDERSTTSPTSGLSLNFSTPINFYGTSYSSLFINNNGNVSFGTRNSTFMDADFGSLASKMIAPFYADVDTRAGGLSARWGRGTVDGHAAFGINWLNVNFYNSSVAHTTGYNSFQMVLVDRSDLGAGNFDIEFNYDSIVWESGMNQNGGDPSGLGGSSARIGFSNGAGDFFQMLGSNVAGSFLDSNPSGLIHGRFMSDVDGRYVYHFRNGVWADESGAGHVNTVPVLTLPDSYTLAEGPGGMTDMPADAGGFFTDPDADNWNVTVDWGDGMMMPLAYDANKAFTLNHTYQGRGVYELKVYVDDGSGEVVTKSTVVTVIDMTPPVVDVLGETSVSEGQWVTLYASSANDPRPDDPVTFSWMCDLNGIVSEDGRTFQVFVADSGTYSAQVVATDEIGNTTVVTVPLTVANVAPTATLTADGASLNEGGSATFSLQGAADVSPLDLEAGLTYSFDLDGDGVFELSGASPVASRVFDDNGTYTVRARVSDQDGDYTEYTMAVAVRNVAPASAGMSGAGTINEGGDVTLTIAPGTDVAADMAAGLLYSFDFDGDGVYEVSGTSRTASHHYDDNGSYTVRGRVSDKDGGAALFETVVVVNNVAPVAAGLTVDGELKEGSALSLSLGAVTDPSVADALAGFTYSYDFDGDGVFDVTGNSPDVTHVYDDNGNYTVVARVTDKDGGHTDYSTLLKVKNVAPRSLQFWDNNPKAEGSLVTVGFDGPSDVSMADTAAGFTYSYDFNNDGVFDLVTTSPTATYTFRDNGVYIVGGRVTDKDGGYTDYTTDVEIYNVAPTARLVNGGPINEGGAVTVRLEGAADASSVDAAAGFTYSFDMDGDGVYELSGTSPSVSKAYAQDGTYTVRGRITDKDGGYSDYTTSVVVRNVAPTVSGFTNNASTLGVAQQGSRVVATGSFADAGVLDRHTAVIDWGDGTSSPATMSEANGGGAFLASHVYAGGGAFTITLRLADDANPAGVATATSNVYVTGVGLYNGVLHVVGTNDRDDVKLIMDNKGVLKVKTDFLKQDPEFGGASVREIRVVLGSGNDKFSTQGTFTQPIYVNGVRYTGRGGVGARALARLLRLFSDVPVAA